MYKYETRERIHHEMPTGPYYKLFKIENHNIRSTSISRLSCWLRQTCQFFYRSKSLGNFVKTSTKKSNIGVFLVQPSSTIILHRVRIMSINQGSMNRNEDGACHLNRQRRAVECQSLVSQRGTKQIAGFDAGQGVRRCREKREFRQRRCKRAAAAT